LEDKKIQEIKRTNKEEKSPSFSEDVEGLLWHKGWICVPNINEMKDKILHEHVYESRLNINDLLNCCSRCKCLSGSGKKLPWILSWVCQELSRDTIPFG
jgi:hypothetical protein